MSELAERMAETGDPGYEVAWTPPWDTGPVPTDRNEYQDARREARKEVLYTASEWVIAHVAAHEDGPLYEERWRAARDAHRAFDAALDRLCTL